MGSYIAGKLAAMGRGVVVLEQHKQVGEKFCCTGIIGQECVNSFATDDNVILRQANSARLFSPSGRELRLRREETQACIIDRVAFDVAMAGRAQAEGAEYILSCLVKNIEAGDDKVRIEALHDGRRLYFETKAIVIAAGFASGLTEGLGMGKSGDFCMGVQAEVETMGIDEVEVYLGQEIAPGFFAWLVPISPRRARVGLLSRHNPGLYLRRLMASLVSQAKIKSAEAEMSYGGIPLKPLPKTYGKRLVVVGDAAGQVKPTTGGGIYYGLLCADIAANTLYQALESNDLSAKSLSSYEREWRRRLGRELRIGYWARKVFERLSDRHIDRILDIIKSNGIDEALLGAEELSFDWHGEVILKLIGHRAVAKATRVVKAPFHLRARA